MEMLHTYDRRIYGFIATGNQLGTQRFPNRFIKAKKQNGRYHLIGAKSMP